MTFFRKLFCHERVISMLMIVLVSMVAYLPLLHQLGYYQDDWHVVWAGNTQGAYKIFDEHLIDRPLLGINTAAAYKLLGDKPIYWHLYAWVWRVIGALLMFLLIQKILPAHHQAITLMAVLFAIYPGFLEQPIALSYQNHFIALALGMLSILLSIHASQSKHQVWKIGLTGIAMLAAFISYQIMEWFIGLEGVRAALFWYLDDRKGLKKFYQKLLTVIKKCFPFFITIGLFLTWRIFIFHGARYTTDVGLLAEKYLENPFSMITRNLVELARDIVETILLAWWVPFYNLVSKSSINDLFFSVIFGLIAVTAVGLYLRYSQKREEDRDRNGEAESRYPWMRSFVWLGIFCVFIALIPIIFANRSVLFEDTFDRYTLTAMFGVALCVIGALYLIPNQHFRVIILSGLIGFSIMTHYHNAATYRDFWKYQRLFWWQLSWRCPDLADGTTLLPLMPVKYRLADSYEVWGPANLIYSARSDPIRISGEVINNETIFYILQNRSYGRVFRRTNLTIDLKNALVASYPGNGSCVHVHDKEKLEISPHEDHLLRLIAGKSNLNLIQTEAKPKSPPADIFGQEPPHTWCYYYQKASLARQVGDWAEVVRLAEEAHGFGIEPQDISEWMPIYEGYARTGQIDKANELGSIMRTDENFKASYCTQFNMQPSTFDTKIDQYIVTNLCPELLSSED